MSKYSAELERILRDTPPSPSYEPWENLKRREMPNECPFCGVAISPRARVCRDHEDLPRRDANMNGGRG